MFLFTMATVATGQSHRLHLFQIGRYIFIYIFGSILPKHREGFLFIIIQLSIVSVDSKIDIVTLY